MHSIGVAVLFNFIDLLSGSLAAVKNKEIESRKLREGMLKKVAFLLCYAIGYLIDHYGQHAGFDLGVEVLTVIIFYAVTTELVSIIENISKLNPDILPEKLLEIFKIGK